MDKVQKMKQCPKCRALFKHSTHFHRHVKCCGTTEHDVQCPYCPKTFTRKDNLNTHIKQKHPQPTAIPPPCFTCEKCQKTFCYQMAFDLHQESCGKPKPFQCSTCGKRFAREVTLKQHLQEHQQKGGGTKRKAEQQGGPIKKLPKKVTEVLPVDKETSTMKGMKVDAFFYPKTQPQLKDQQVFFEETRSRLKAHLENVLKEKKGIKWNLMYHCTLSMTDPYRREVRTHQGYFRTPHPLITLYPQQLGEQLNAALETVEERMTIFAQAGSGWTLEQNQALVLEMVDYRPIGGTSYIELPKDVYDTKSIVNVKNKDQQCFMWSVLAALHPADHNPQRVSHYEPFKEELNFTGIEFPSPLIRFPSLRSSILTSPSRCLALMNPRIPKKSPLNSSP